MNRGWYSRRLFPHLVHWSMRQPGFDPMRRALLSQASGRVMEIGFGTGANLPFYPPHIEFLTGIDPNPGMIPILRSNFPANSTMVNFIMASAECLPFPDASFDTVVSTMTLCSVPDFSQTMQELLRVLKLQGRLLFLEHGESPDSSVCRWQQRLTPIWKTLGDGCHLNRPVAQLLQKQGWVIKELENFYLPGVPRPFGYFYQGMAVKA